MPINIKESIVKQIDANGRRVYTANDNSVFSVPITPDRSSVTQTTLDDAVHKYLYGWTVMVEDAYMRREINLAAYLVLRGYVRTTKTRLEQQMDSAPESFDDQITIWNVGELLDAAREQMRGLNRVNINDIKLHQFGK